MPSPSRISPQPRLTNQAGLAEYLGMSPSAFCQKRERLLACGMPEKLKDIGLYDLRRIDAWLDGLGSSINADNDNPLKTDWSEARGSFK